MGTDPDAVLVSRSASLLREYGRLLLADLSRNPFRTERMTLLVWRLGQAAHGRPGGFAFLLRRVHSVLDTVWCRGLMGAELPRSVDVGPGLRLPHGGRGVIVHPSVRVGSGATIYHRVTLGVRGGHAGPRLGDDVYVGTGASVLGAVVVGHGASVGAGAVVVRDVPAGARAVGVPAHGFRQPSS